MLACRRVHASFLTVLAWADRATVFGVTDSPLCGKGKTNFCSGHVVQVSFIHLLAGKLLLA